MTSWAQELLDELSEEQRSAVLATDGPVLILAGAGSGKTRVITYRISYLVAAGLAAPSEILALTFTNKAAREMRERVVRLLGAHREVHPSSLWITTFHSFGARILRIHAKELGYDPGFVIYDEDDSARVVKKVFHDLNLLDGRVLPSGFLGWLDSNRADQLELTGSLSEPSYLETRYREIHAAYRAHLKRQNAMDFRDLLWRMLELFTRFPETLASYQQRFRYVLVDEYQDTNRVQYRLVRHLAGPQGNLTVVGDEDQSIYSWRGADIQN
ncbi:MAG: UvrD-helicase domain-containing protein, partial [Candidatus Riflebacteria bacterium]|nr:UvrD-helicase domain-containing protein [Candidatus Riflebacteria bacterium]